MRLQRFLVGISPLLLAAFGVIRPGAQIGMWSWIIGYGLLLIACRVRGL